MNDSIVILVHMPAIPKFAEVTRFVALLKQASEGCDYTIGCGLKVVTLEATTPEEAVAAARELSRRFRHDENRLQSLQILAVAGSFETPIETWYGEFENEVAEGKAATQRMSDYAELIRLHEKLGLPRPPALEVQD